MGPTPLLRLLSVSPPKMLRSLLLVSLVSLGLAGEVPIQDCGSKATIESITFDGCDAFPCVVHHGQHATGKLTMTALAPADSLTCKITGIIAGGIELPFNGCPVDACEHLDNGDCPVEEAEALVYDMDIPIENFYPTIEITGKWRLLDDLGENFLCFTIPMKIEA